MATLTYAQSRTHAYSRILLKAVDLTVHVDWPHDKFPSHVFPLATVPFARSLARSSNSVASLRAQASSRAFPGLFCKSAPFLRNRYFVSAI